MTDQQGFLDLDERYAALSKAGDPLERPSGVIDFEIFRGEPDAARNRSDGSQGGRPPMDAVLMFKVLVIQALYGLSDAQAAFQILDRRSFGRFLGLDDGDKVADETTIWRVREALVQARAVDKLFTRFDVHLKEAGYLAMRAGAEPPADPSSRRNGVATKQVKNPDGAMPLSVPGLGLRLIRTI